MKMSLKTTALVTVGGISLLSAVFVWSKRPTPLSYPRVKANLAPIESGFGHFSTLFLKGVHPPKDKNFAYSPISMEMALLMLGPGLSLKDQQTLGASVGMSPQDVSNSQAPLAIAGSLYQRNAIMANSVWVGPKFSLYRDYQRQVQALDGAEAHSLTGLGTGGADQINNWVALNTKNRIQKLFDSLRTGTCMVLVNALTFDGKWQRPFDALKTAKGSWTTQNSHLTAMMMHSDENIPLAQYPTYTVGRLNYKDNDMCMDMILPKGLSDPWQALLSAKTTLLTGTPHWNAKSTSVEMPKFEFNLRQNMNPVMNSIGLGSFLNEMPQQRMVKTTLGVSVDQVEQAIWVKIDEEGTKAAAATGVGCEASSIMVQPHLNPFNVDHPFAFVIRDLKTGAILFAGAVYQPE